MIYKNLLENDLIDKAVENEGAKLSSSGALCVYTGKHTGRSPKAKRIVNDSLTRDTIDWSNNLQISEKEFDQHLEKFLKFKEKNNLYLQEVSAVRDPNYQLKINVWAQYAKHSLFARNMFVPNTDDHFKADYELYHFPSLCQEPTVLISFEKRIILISGTLYSGEIKKSVFTVLNYWFPEKWEFLAMHCSVNMDKDRKNPTIFFGLSGTGKTTLSSDEDRILIGDDEHGWTDKGLVNFEGGCYAKTIRLSRDDEPQIWDACHMRGTILENVVLKDGVADFEDSKHTENTRASYPTYYIDNADGDGFINEQPKNIVMLTCDAFGVLPPVCKLNPDEAVQQFLLGYTAKVAGTEQGVKEPIATFSPCFGLPFMPLPPSRYGEILRDKVIKNNVNCWLVNTGWIGGGYGVGKRIPIRITRKIIDLINSGEMAKFDTFKHEFTGFTIPDVQGDAELSSVLRPESSWQGNAVRYMHYVEILMDSFSAHYRTHRS